MPTQHHLRCVSPAAAEQLQKDMAGAAYVNPVADGATVRWQTDNPGAAIVLADFAIKQRYTTAGAVDALIGRL